MPQVCHKRHLGNDLNNMLFVSPEAARQLDYMITEDFSFVITAAMPFMHSYELGLPLKKRSSITVIIFSMESPNLFDCFLPSIS